jgi:hypothetical protein
MEKEHPRVLQTEPRDRVSRAPMDVQRYPDGGQVSRKICVLQSGSVPYGWVWLANLDAFRYWLIHAAAVSEVERSRDHRSTADSMYWTS